MYNNAFYAEGTFKKKKIEKKRAQIVYLTSTLLIKVIGSLSSIFF